MNNKKNIFCVISGLLLYAASQELSYAEDVVPGSNVLPFETVLIKFGITMAAVAVSILIIWICLKMFKSYVKQQFELNRQKILNKDSENTVKNVDDAIVSFINKNRL